VQPPHFVDEQIATQQVQKIIDSCRQHNWELVAYLVDGDRVDYLVVDHQARRVMTPAKVKSKLETYRAKLQSQPEAQTAQNGLGLSNVGMSSDCETVECADAEDCRGCGCQTNDPLALKFRARKVVSR